MALGSFLFLKEQIKDIIIISGTRSCSNKNTQKHSDGQTSLPQASARRRVAHDLQHQKRVEWAFGKWYSRKTLLQSGDINYETWF